MAEKEHGLSEWKRISWGHKHVLLEGDLVRLRCCGRAEGEVGPQPDEVNGANGISNKTPTFNLEYDYLEKRLHLSVLVCLRLVP